MKIIRVSLIITIYLLVQLNIFAQGEITTSIEGANWGYSYDSTLTYLNEISQNQYVKIDSIGPTIEERALWMVTISQVNQHFDQMYRVAIHARTHPNETQSQWLTQKIIDNLISDSDLAKMLRRRVIFNIVPMYNPDGVELEYTRYNANGIDLERNWFVENPEPESAALKAKYYDLMNSFPPINIMLNMHGDNGADQGYFYYHHENGTSIEYTEIEKNFISKVHQYYVNGIGDWQTHIAWSDGTPLLYPESWFWVNYQEDVMAITFEEYPVESRMDSVLDKTAKALLNGIVDYLDIRSVVNVERNLELITYQLEQNYPNPFNPTTNIKYSVPSNEYVSLKVYDILGNEVSTLVDDQKSKGYYEIKFDASKLTSGVYIYRMTAGKFSEIKKMILIK